MIHFFDALDVMCVDAFCARVQDDDDDSEDMMTTERAFQLESKISEMYQDPDLVGDDSSDTDDSASEPQAIDMASPGRIFNQSRAAWRSSLLRADQDELNDPNWTPDATTGSLFDCVSGGSMGPLLRPSVSGRNLLMGGDQEMQQLSKAIHDARKARMSVLRKKQSGMNPDLLAEALPGFQSSEDSSGEQTRTDGSDPTRNPMFHDGLRQVSLRADRMRADCMPAAVTGATNTPDAPTREGQTTMGPVSAL